MSPSNDRYLRALRRQPVDRTPIWIMRQAGRYLPEYRATRAEAGDFLSLCKNPELACEVTLQPLRRFDLDAAILFSDILTIPDAMGLGLSLNEGIGPRFAHPLRSASDIAALRGVDMEKELGYVMAAVSTIRKALNELDNSVPLIGFSGSPWTLATYMIEGGSSRDFKYAKGMIYQDPAAARQLLRLLSEQVSEYLIAQVHAGAQALMVFDTWGGALSTPMYHEFSLRWMSDIVAAVRADKRCDDVPITLFTKGGGGWLEAIADTGCDGIGLDWTMPLADAKARVGHRVCLQGNMDPTVLYADGAAVAAEARRVLADFGEGDGHVFNLGHGIHPTIDPENVKTLVDTVHEASAR